MRRPAHPHVRGEDAESQRESSALSGSPPRAWGGPLTPSRAAAVCGSPPRAWGGRQEHNPPGADRRLTPMCVGRTPGRWLEFLDQTAHPHVRGEDGTRLPLTQSWRGSPPRAWGGPGLPDVLVVAVRLTPTCVGRTTYSSQVIADRSAHPHVRGEDLFAPGAAGRGGGSPPRAWGGLAGESDRLPVVRLTPTCVGRTPGCPDTRRV